MNGKVDQPVVSQPAIEGGDKPLSSWWTRWFGQLANHINHVMTGNGTPEGTVIAPPGRLYLDQAGGASVTLYVKESGTSSTGWVAK